MTDELPGTRGVPMLQHLGEVYCPTDPIKLTFDSPTISALELVHMMIREKEFIQSEWALIRRFGAPDNYRRVTRDSRLLRHGHGYIEL